MRPAGTSSRVRRRRTGCASGHRAETGPVAGAAKDFSSGDARTPRTRPAIRGRRSGRGRVNSFRLGDSSVVYAAGEDVGSDGTAGARGVRARWRSSGREPSFDGRSQVRILPRRESAGGLPGATAHLLGSRSAMSGSAREAESVVGSRVRGEGGQRRPLGPAAGHGGVSQSIATGPGLRTPCPGDLPGVDPALGHGIPRCRPPCGSGAPEGGPVRLACPLISF